jgi:TRAP-type C4-dicarboxylate transport system permease small subunit
MTNSGESLLERVNGRISIWFARIAAFILAMIGVVTFCDVIARYFFHRPFTFTVEMTEVLMGMVIFLGIGLTTHDERHITVDVVTLRMPVAVRAVLEIVMSIVGLGMLGAMVWEMFLTAKLLHDEGQYTQIHEVIVWPFAYVMAFASILFLTGLLLYILRALRKIKSSFGT